MTHHLGLVGGVAAASLPAAAAAKREGRVLDPRTPSSRVLDPRTPSSRPAGRVQGGCLSLPAPAQQEQRHMWAGSLQSTSTALPSEQPTWHGALGNTDRHVLVAAAAAQLRRAGSACSTVPGRAFLLHSNQPAPRAALCVRLAVTGRTPYSDACHRQAHGLVGAWCHPCEPREHLPLPATCPHLFVYTLKLLGSAFDMRASSLMSTGWAVEQWGRVVMTGGKQCSSMLRHAAAARRARTRVGGAADSGAAASAVAR